MQPLQPKDVLVPKPALVQGMKSAPFVFVSGQVAFDLDNNVVAPGDYAAQTTFVLENVRRILAEGGATLSDVVKSTVYIADFGGYQAFDAAYAKAFGDHRPAREVVRAGLVLPEIVVEISAVAVIQGG